MKITADYKEILEFIGLVLGTITAVAVATKQGRDWFVEVYKNFQIRRKLKKELPYFISNINSELSTIKDDIKKIKYETTPNSGGTMMGYVKLIKAEIEATNWLSPRPTFRTTSAGLNVFVNEAYCQLCGVTSDELMRLGWKNFAADADEVDDFYDRWLISSKELSQFSSKLKIQNKFGDYKGEWVFRIRYLGPIDNTFPIVDHLWHGSLYPHDDVAKNHARQYNIPLFV